MAEDNQLEIKVDPVPAPKPEHPALPWLRWAGLLLAMIVISLITGKKGDITLPPLPGTQAVQQPPVVVFTLSGSGSCPCQAGALEKK